jgi:hypothetical protein
MGQQQAKWLARLLSLTLSQLGQTALFKEGPTACYLESDGRMSILTHYLRQEHTLHTPYA